MESKLLYSGDNVYNTLFWFGQILIGGILPLALLYCPKPSKSRKMIGLASIMVIIGGFCQLYVIIIGGQVFPMTLVAGYEATSTFSDGVIATYAPSIWEIMLGLGGVGITLFIVTFALKIFSLIPEDLSDKLADPHHG